MAFSHNLTILRGLHNLSNAKAAGLLGYSQQTLSEWQTGKQAPSLNAAHAIARFFEVPLDVLLDGTPQEVALAHLEGERWASIEAKITPQPQAGRAADG